MSEWTDKPWAAGTQVEVFDLDNKKIGVGTLVKDYVPITDRDEDYDIDANMPEIRMEDGRVILGCDCWWIPVEVTEQVKTELGVKDYAVNVTVKGYDGLTMEVNVLAKDPDDALAQACAVEPRYQDEDPYILLVLVGEDDSSVFCTYPNLNEATKHIGTLRGGRWMLVQRDFEEKGEGTVIKSWEDDD